MELIDIIPVFNLYEEYWKIFTKSDILPPQYISAESTIERSIIGEGTSIYGSVHNSVIGSGVTIGKGAVIRNSIIMQGVVIGEGTVIDKAIIADQSQVGAGVKIGVGEFAASKLDPKVYNADLVVVGEKSYIPDGVSIGKNTAISGVTEKDDYPNGALAGGEYVIKAGGIL